MQLTIRHKLLLGLTVVLILGLGGLALSVRNTNLVLRDTLEIAEHDLPGIALIINADRDAYQSNLGIALALEAIGSALDADRQVTALFLDDAVATISDNRDQVLQRFNQFVDLFPDSTDDPTFASALSSFERHSGSWSDLTDQLIADIRAVDRAGYERARGTYHGGRYAGAFDPMRDTLDVLTEWTEQRAATAAGAAAIDVERILRASLGIALSLVGGLAVVAFVLSRAIVRPLSNLHDALQDVAKGDGDLTKKLRIARRDEISRVAGAFNDFTDALAGIIGNIQQEARSLANVRRTISESVEASGEAIGVIDTVAGRMDELSKGLKAALESFTQSVEAIETKARGLDDQVHDQASMVEQSTASVQQMIASVGNVTKVSQAKGAASRKLQDSAAAGRDRMTESVQAVESINMRVGSVIEMTAIIKRIAGTTNLLAMNAAIEAAHAGQYGRGFAVVADEIRKLAETTSGQSRGIAETLGAIVEDVHKAVDISNASQTGYEEMYATIEDVGNAFEEIVANMSELQTGSRQILDAMTSLQASSASVRDGSGDIRAETERLTSGIAAIQLDANNTAAAAADLTDKQARVSTLLAAMTAATEHLAESSNHLVQEVDRFTVATEAESAPAEQPSV